MPITRTALVAALQVRGQVVCDCGGFKFEVGIAIGLGDNGNTFIRVLECTACHHQLTVVHKADSGLAPALAT